MKGLQNLLRKYLSAYWEPGYVAKQEIMKLSLLQGRETKTVCMYVYIILYILYMLIYILLHLCYFSS